MKKLAPVLISVLSIAAILGLLFLFFWMFVGGRMSDLRHLKVRNNENETMDRVDTAVDHYRIVQGIYPAMISFDQSAYDKKLWQSAGGESLMTFDALGRAGRPGSPGLTTPVDYIRPIGPAEIAQDLGQPFPIAYWTDETNYLLFCPGPDGRFDITHPEMELIGSGAQLRFRDVDLLFDPTNGTRSNGDIIRMGSWEQKPVGGSQDSLGHAHNVP